MAAITAELKLEIGKFRKGIIGAKSATASLAKSAAGMGKRIAKGLFGGVAAAARVAARAARGALLAVAAAGVTAGAAITAGLKKAFDLGGRLSDVAARIGDTAGNAQVLETMFAQTGVAAEKMAPTIQKMQRAIIEARDMGGTLALPFEELGLDIEALGRSGGIEAFHAISKAITELDSDAEKSARAMQIFGRSGGELLTLFSDPEALAKAQSMVGSQASILSRAANDFDRASDIWNGLSSKVTGMFVGMGDEMIGHFLPALEALNKIDLAPIGQRLGKSLSAAIDIVKNGFSQLGASGMFDLVKDALEIVFKSAVNTMWKGLVGAAGAAGTLWIEGIKNSITAFQVVSSKDFWTGLGNGLKAAARSFAEIMYEVVANVLSGLKDIPVIGPKFATAAKAISGNITDNNTARDKEIGNADLIKGRISETLKNVGGSFSKGFKNAEGPFKNLDELRSTLSATINSLKGGPRIPREDAPITRRPGATTGAIPDATDTPATAGAAIAKRAAIPVSSLARIGGGGRAGNLDTAARAAQQQVTLQRKMEGHLRKMASTRSTNSPFAAVLA